MPTFASYDGTNLAYHVAGDGPVLVCIAGGPGRASEYFGDLGGLPASYTMIRLDSRGTGSSEVPADPASYRMDRLAEDVEALRAHLGLAEMNLLGHSAGANVVAHYVAKYPERVARLVILTGLLRAAGMKPVGADAARAARSGEPWYEAAIAAEAAWDALPDDCTPADEAPFMAAVEPFLYGAWTEAAQAHAVAGHSQFSDDASEGFGAGYELDAAGMAAKLARVDAPVLVVAGEVDANTTPAAAAEEAKLFPRSEVVTIPGGGHFPWVDNPAAVVGAIDAFLSSSR